MNRFEISPMSEGILSNGCVSEEKYNTEKGKNKIKCKTKGGEDSSELNEERVKIYCRLRPFYGINTSFFKFEENNKDGINHYLSINRSSIKDKNLESLGGKFKFDYIFDEEFTQIEVFQETCVNLISELVEERKSSVIIANGLNNSGKTYTMVGDVENPGLLPLSLRFVYDLVKEKNDKRIKMYCNYIDIDEQNVYDLLTEKDSEKKLLRMPTFYLKEILPEVHYFNLETIQDCSNALNIGNRKKNMRRGCSMTHTIFKIILRFFDKNNNDFEEASIFLLDLAHQENKPFANLSNLDCDEMENKLKNIPQDLYYQHLSLCKIVKSLHLLKNRKATRENKPKTAYCHLTRFLRYYLFRNDRIVLITNINPCIDQADENLKAFHFSTMFKEGIKILDKTYSKEKVINKMKSSLTSEKEREINRRLERIKTDNNKKNKTPKIQGEDREDQEEETKITLKKENKNNIEKENEKKNEDDFAMENLRKFIDNPKKLSINEKSQSPIKNTNDTKMEKIKLKMEKDDSPNKTNHLSKVEKNNLFNILKKNAPMFDDKNKTNPVRDSYSSSMLRDWPNPNSGSNIITDRDPQKFSNGEIEKMKKDYENLKKKFEEQQKLLKEILDEKKNHNSSTGLDKEDSKLISDDKKECIKEVQKLLEGPVYEDSLRIFNSHFSSERTETLKPSLRSDGKLYNIILMNPSIQNFTILNRHMGCDLSTNKQDGGHENIITKEIHTDSAKKERKDEEKENEINNLSSLFTCDDKEVQKENKNIFENKMENKPATIKIISTDISPVKKKRIFSPIRDYNKDKRRKPVRPNRNRK